MEMWRWLGPYREPGIYPLLGTSYIINQGGGLLTYSYRGDLGQTGEQSLGHLGLPYRKALQM